MRNRVVWASLAGLIGCTGPRPGDGEQSAPAVVASDVVTTIEAEVQPDSVRFSLHVMNAGAVPLPLEFNTSARYDFEVRSSSGTPEWRWSADQMFAQVLGVDTIAAGESRVFRAAWAPAGRTGRFVVLGRVVAANRVIEQQAGFEIPTR